MQIRMKILIIVCLVVFLLMITVTGCSTASSLEKAMKDYSRIVDETMPEDSRLTIYYIAPHILTRMPLSVEDLKTFREVKIITVASEELEAHWTLFEALDPSVLQPVKEKSYINARLYYVFEAGSESLLEVVISDIHGSVFVNGVEVEDHPAFYEIIIPYLTDEDRTILGI